METSSKGHKKLGAYVWYTTEPLYPGHKQERRGLYPISEEEAEQSLVGGVRRSAILEKIYGD